MRIIAVDDEKLALDALLGSIRKAAPEAEIDGFKDAAEALNFLKDQPCEVAFLDVEMPEMNGVELAKRMKMIYPNINIIFSTGYDQYRGVAFGLHASGYLTKPILPEDVRWELEDLRRPVQMSVTKRIRVQAFGNFEVFLDGLPVRFKYQRTKEMLAYLVDRAGAYCTNGELLGILFENEPGHEAYLKKLRQDLLIPLTEQAAVRSSYISGESWRWTPPRSTAIITTGGTVRARRSISTGASICPSIPGRSSNTVRCSP